MILRLALLAAVFLATAEVAPPPPPAVLIPYISGAHFDPGDYGWMRGRFADAPAADQSAWRSVQAWLTTCQASGRAAVEAELRTLGIAQPHLDQVPLMAPLCAEVSSVIPHVVTTQRVLEFQASVVAAEPYTKTFLYAVDRADEAARQGSNFAEALLMRPVTDQMVRFALQWEHGSDEKAPPLPDGVRPIVLAAIGGAMIRIDHDNTEWLKRHVAEEGWPSVSKVGERPSDAAWLLVQHADADPVFQLKVLRLMAPLEARHDLPARNYAYLYDRIMLKLTGKQRYGTQATCADGKRVPQPLEDGEVAHWREQAGLEPIDDYIAHMNKTFGPCLPTGKPS